MSASGGSRISSTSSVMAMAKTPSLKASSRVVVDSPESAGTAEVVIASERGAFDAELPHLGVQGGALHAEPRGSAVGAGDHAPGIAQRLQDHVALALVIRALRRAGRGGRSSGGGRRRQPRHRWAALK